MIYGSQLWHRIQDPHHQQEPLRRLEYQALKRITGAYHGSNQRKLSFIANVELIQAILDHSSICWAARNVGNGDPLIIEAIQGADFSDGHDPHATNRTITNEAFHLSNTSLQELSISNREDLRAFPNVTLPPSWNRRRRTRR